MYSNISVPSSNLSLCGFLAMHVILSTFYEEIVKLLMNKLIKMGVIFRNIPVGFHAPD